MNQEEQAKHRTRRALQQTLTSLQGWGVSQIPKCSVKPLPQQEVTTEAEFEEKEKVDRMSSGRATAEREAALQIVQQEVAACTKCRELATMRTQTVFGVGNPHARLCFLGEAPGADEDRLGEPFVGRAGQLLTKIIEACTLRREDVYILNMLKCRPPNNRNPTSMEVANCSGFLHRQLEILQPEFICCLGGVAATNLLETTQSIGRLRGRFYLYRGIPVMVTYHPAYLLRNPSAKRLVWDDMKVLMREMGIEIAS